MTNNDVEYLPKFLDSTLSTHYFNYLRDNVKWANTLKTVDGTFKKIKRKMAYFYDKIVDYKYANFFLPGQVWTPELATLRNLVEEPTGLKFNSVLLNMYENGKDEIKWHSDKETQLGENPVIVSLNLGATRKFHMLAKANGGKMFYPLSHGDLLIMKENCQKNWLHAILPEKEVTEPRISLTFRWVYEN